MESQCIGWETLPGRHRNSVRIRLRCRGGNPVHHSVNARADFAQHNEKYPERRVGVMRQRLEGASIGARYALRRRLTSRALVTKEMNRYRGKLRPSQAAAMNAAVE